MTSDALPLGTPVPPNASAGRTELTTRSAAARAAARPKPIASGADCTRKAASRAADDPKAAVGEKAKAGLVGNPAGPSTAASATRSGAPSRIDC